MDELKMKLSTKFMKSIVAKIVSKAIFKKIGCEINIQFNDIELTTHDGKVYLHANVDGEMNDEEFKKLIKAIGMD